MNEIQQYLQNGANGLKHRIESSENLEQARRAAVSGLDYVDVGYAPRTWVYSDTRTPILNTRCQRIAERTFILYSASQHTGTEHLFDFLGEVAP